MFNLNINILFNIIELESLSSRGRVQRALNPREVAHHPVNQGSRTNWKQNETPQETQIKHGKARDYGNYTSTS
jgi:hypothetical protein